VLPVEVALGRVHLTGFTGADVRIEIPELGLDHRVLLDAAAPRARWVAVTRRLQAPAARVRATWLRDDGPPLDSPWEPIGASLRILDSPWGELRRARLVVVAAGELTGLSKLIVEVRALGAEPDAVEIFELTAPGQEREASLAVAELAIGYEYRVTAVYEDGAHRADAWRASDRPVLVVRDRARVDVTVTPRLLDLGGAWLLARVELRHVDPVSGDEQRAALTLTRAGEPAHWHFRARDPSRRDWEHRVTLVAADGSRHVRPWEQARSDVLVLAPPPE